MEVLLWFLWLCSAPVLSLETEKKLWFESRPRTWDEAQLFCRSKYGELATAETSSDSEDLKAMDLSVYQAWVGLKKRDSGWRWWNGYEEYPIEDLFAEGEPQSGHECGKIIRKQDKAYTDDCEQRHFFYCESRYHLQYEFVTESRPWAEALQHCQDQSMQFFDSPYSSNFPYLTSPTSLQDFPVWIGPVTADHGSGSCTSISSLHDTMKAYDCSRAFPFICERHSLVLVKELLSWDQGLEVCSNISGFDSQGDFGLLRVEESDLQDVLKHITGATSSKVWLGLRFLAGSWFWSDGSVVSLPSLPPCPEARLRCGALVLNTSSIEPADCSQELNVLCHRRQ